MYRIRSCSECICLKTFLASVICLAIGHSAYGQSDDAQTVAAIIKSLHSLDDEVKSVNFTMATKVFKPADSSSHPHNMRFFDVEQKDLKDTEGVDVNYDAKHILKIDGEKMRRFSEHPEGFPAVMRNNKHVRYNLETDDGKDARTLSTSSFKERFPQGTISVSSPDSAHMFKTTAYQPVHYFCNPMKSELFEGKGLSVSPGKSFSIDGKEYVQLESRQFGTTNEFLVTVGKDSRVISWTSKRNDGTIHIQVEITYEETDKHGPIPIAWTVKQLEPDGRLQRLCEVNVLEYEINSKIPPEEFTIEFPVGTLVIDENEDVEYIVRPNGEKRLITEAEQRAQLTSEQLLNSETDELVPVAGAREESP